MGRPRTWIALAVGVAVLGFLWLVEAPQDRASRAAHRPVAEAGGPGERVNAEVVVYTSSSCGWCRKTMAWLDTQRVDYQNLDIDAEASNRARLVGLTGHPTVPVVVIDGQLVRGFDPVRMRRLLAAL